MKICFVHEEYPLETNFGGIATYQKNMAEELVKQGNKVYVICRGLKEDKNYIENGVNIFRVYVKETKNQKENYIKYLKKVANILIDLQKKELIDIIEVPDWGAETVFFEKYRKIPLVVRLHTPLKVWLKYNQNNFGKITKSMLKWEEEMLNKADLVTCCSYALEKIIKKTFNLNDIVVIPNPANITNFYYKDKIKKENKLIFVGSLEERKGVIALAEALNLVFDKYPNLKIQFIGKDTTRNKKNISTKQYIYDVVNPIYHNNLIFLGQLPNYELNEYLNSSLVGIFPSLFDNFPYVVLEAMITGLQIVGSRNSGMVEMLNQDSIYETGNSNDLANKIIEKYKLSLIENINFENIKTVKERYNPTNICLKMTDLYIKTIKKYYSNNTSLNELQTVLNKIVNENIVKFKKEKQGIANLVYKVTTTNNVYIVKKYLYNYDFNLENELYNKYEKCNINVIRPLNNEIINYNFMNYNIFPYIKEDKNKVIEQEFLDKIINCNRNVDSKPILLDKCNNYYNYLKENNINNKDIIYVLNTYENIKDLSLFKETSLNHGDISKGNILCSNKKNYLIDFDEVTITTPLYDLAVIIIKQFVKNNKINYNLNEELKIVVKFYLCKILLEKYYLHIVGKINLFSHEQKKDNYKKYLKLLKKVN